MSIVSWYLIVTRAWQAFKLRASAKVMGEFWHAKSFDEGIEILQSQDQRSPFSALALRGASSSRTSS
jgi:biopolymer transport protein ExbB